MQLKSPNIAAIVIFSLLLIFPNSVYINVADYYVSRYGNDAGIMRCWLRILMTIMAFPPQLI